MKTTLIAFSALIIGTILGTTVMLLKQKHDFEREVGTLALGVVTDEAIYGTLLFEKRYDDLQRMIENGMLVSLNYQKNLMPSNEYSRSQKLVRGYFDLTGRQVSDMISKHIQAVPSGSGPNYA